MRRVYIAGPITKPDPFKNTLEAIVVADLLLHLGYAPFVPHLSYFWDKYGENGIDLPYGEKYEVWMKYDFEWLAQCEAVLRLPGFSLGADREEAYAATLGIPVFHSIDQLCQHEWSST